MWYVGMDRVQGNIVSCTSAESVILAKSSPFEQIRKVNEAGNEYWESRDLAEVLEYTQYRNFEAVIEKAKLACFNSGYRIEDHFANVSKMIEIGKGGRREIKVTLLSRYACYLAIQNADPNKEIVAHGQTYFAIQTRRQELADESIEEERRVLLREEMRHHNEQLANGAKVRQTIQELGGTMPKDLPVAESIKKIETKQKGAALSMQVDTTATPKHNNGAIFVQTVTDYPLVEAISQNIVKHPVLLDASSRAKLSEPQSAK